MANRMNPGKPPGGSQEPISTRRSPLDEVRETSHALREVLRQQEELGPVEPGSMSAVIDLVTVWRAALSDDGCPDRIGRRRYMSPRRFVNGWEHHVTNQDDGESGKLLVDLHAAFAYTQQLDSRVLEATIDEQQWKQDEMIRLDPILAGVCACQGGPFGMMFVAHKGAAAAGITLDEYHVRVLERAKELAATLDDHAAETLVAGVRQAIEGAPRFVEVDRAG